MHTIIKLLFLKKNFFLKRQQVLHQLRNELEEEE